MVVRAGRVLAGGMQLTSRAELRVRAVQPGSDGQQPYVFDKDADINSAVRCELRYTVTDSSSAVVASRARPRWRCGRVLRSALRAPPWSWC